MSALRAAAADGDANADLWRRVAKVEGAVVWLVDRESTLRESRAPVREYAERAGAVGSAADAGGQPLARWLPNRRLAEIAEALARGEPCAEMRPGHWCADPRPGLPLVAVAGLVGADDDTKPFHGGHPLGVLLGRVSAVASASRGLLRAVMGVGRGG